MSRRGQAVKWVEPGMEGKGRLVVGAAVEARNQKKSDCSCISRSTCYVALVGVMEGACLALHPTSLLE